MAAAVSSRPYRDFLNASLHRKFVSASLYTLFLCYGIAIWMSDWESYFWSWFPLGPVGVRALLLYIPALLIYFLRVEQWHVGQRNTETAVENFTRVALSKRTVLTITRYGMSAFFYGEVYIWSRSRQGRLHATIDHGKFTERIKMNERPVFLRFMFLTLAVIQAVIHLWADYDEIRIPVKKAEQRQKQDLPRYLLANIGPMASRCLITVAATFPIGTIAYFALGRSIFWQTHYYFLSTFVSLSKNPKPSGLAPFISLLLIVLVQGTLLTLLWQFSNETFSLYISQEPLKKGNPITSDSKDPNGSLLNGLKAKKGAVKSIAFWELALITERFAVRRKTIYTDQERKKGDTYKQVTDVCSAEIRAILDRINSALDPSYRSADISKPASPGPIKLVRQIAQPVNDGAIVGPKIAPTTRWEKVGAVTSEIARTNSSPQNAQNSYAKKYLKEGQERAAEGVRKAEAWWEEYNNKLAASPIGWPFRHSLSRLAQTVVTGAPYSRQCNIYNAITTLTNLTVHSLLEDPYGNYQNEIADIVRLFTITIKGIEAYMQGLQIHWTDFNTLAKPEAQRRSVKEVDEVVTELKDGLEKIIRAFNEYLHGLKLDSEEIRQAKALISKGPEVAQLR